jgi:hypothetical protein
VAPAEAPQERAQGRGCLDRVTEDPGRPTRAEGVCVVDAVAPGEGRGDEGQELVADVRPALRPPEVKVLVDQLAQAEVLGQGGRQEEPPGMWVRVASSPDNAWDGPALSDGPGPASKTGRCT